VIFQKHPARVAVQASAKDGRVRGFRYTTHGDAQAHGDRVYVREDVAEQVADKRCAARDAAWAADACALIGDQTHLRDDLHAAALRELALEARVVELQEALADARAARGLSPGHAPSPQPGVQVLPLKIWHELGRAEDDVALTHVPFSVQHPPLFGPPEEQRERRVHGAVTAYVVELAKVSPRLLPSEDKEGFLRVFVRDCDRGRLLTIAVSLEWFPTFLTEVETESGG